MGNEQNKLLLKTPKISDRAETVWLFFLSLFFFQKQSLPLAQDQVQ